MVAALVCGFTSIVFLQPHRFWDLFVNELIIYGSNAIAAFLLSFVLIPVEFGGIPLDSRGHFAVLAVMATIYGFTFAYLLYQLARQTLA